MNGARINTVHNRNMGRKSIETGKVYYAEEAIAKLKYPCCNDNMPYALILMQPKKRHTKRESKFELWDMNMFRPDIRNDEKLMQKVISCKDGAHVIVLYELEKNHKIPKYIYWDDMDNYSCKNVRKIPKT